MKKEFTVGGSAQANSKNQFPSQKKISENSRPSFSSIIPRRVFLQRLAHERHLQRIADDVTNYFVAAVIFLSYEFVFVGTLMYVLLVVYCLFTQTGVFRTVLVLFIIRSICLLMFLEKRLP
jgi:hypothetical protein